MKQMEIFEEAKEMNLDLKEAGINPTLYWAYRHSRERGKEYLDFGEPIRDEELDEILEQCRKYGFETFTISSRFSSLTVTLGELDKRGAKIQGMAWITGGTRNFKTGEPETIPAVVIKVG